MIYAFRRERASVSLVTVVTTAAVAVTTVTMATVARDDATVVREKRATLSLERAIRIVRQAGLASTVTEVIPLFLLI